MDQVPNGDESLGQTCVSLAWAGLYERNSARVLHFVKRLVGRSSESLAEDLTHETFVIAFANSAKFRGSSSESTWLCGIAYNLTRRHKLREALKSRALVDFSRFAVASGTDTQHVRHEVEDALAEAASELPEKLRDAFVLHCIRGLSAREAAHELGVSEGNLRVRVARARATLRQRLLRSPRSGTPG